MAVLNKIKHVIDKIFEVISTIILAVMTVLVVYQVITRYVFNAPSAISEILSQYQAKPAQRASTNTSDRKSVV